MRVSVNWLKGYLDFDCPAKELADRLTMAGLEVEDIIEMSAAELAAHGGSGETDDLVLDVKVTPNRGDCLSMVGIAREVAALLDKSLKMPGGPVEGTPPAASELIKIDIEDVDLCGRYVGAVVRNAKIADSPGWMKDRLVAAGMRPINNVVDITNYVMFELGQPLHAFDYDLLRGSRIIVRRARPGETLTSIDGVQRRLEPDMLVIADADHAVAIAGVMGGEESEVGGRTQDILVESANFNSTSIRRTSKGLGMVTESSYRFERGVDPGVTAQAALRAAELMRDVAGADVAQGIVDANPVPASQTELVVRPERVNSVLGTGIDSPEMVGYLNRLQIHTETKDGLLHCQVPTFRGDITREIDLVEEIGRLHGFDKLPATLPSRPMIGSDSPEGVFANRLRCVLMRCGAQEVLTHSLVDSKLAALVGKSESCLRVRNPLSEELDAMRAMLIPGLLQVIRRNQAFGVAGMSVFEIGKVYFRTAAGGIDERLSVSAAMFGSLWEGGWGLPLSAFEADFYACKGAVEAVLEGLQVSEPSFCPSEHVLLHPTRSASVASGARELGILGEVSPEVLAALDLRGRPCVFELDLAAVTERARPAVSCEPPPRYPAVCRHLAVVVQDSVAYGRIASVVRSSGGELVEEVDLLDVYKGEQIGADCRSLTLSMVFRARDRTLKDEEVSGVIAGIREALRREVGASFRQL